MAMVRARRWRDAESIRDADVTRPTVDVDDDTGADDSRPPAVLPPLPVNDAMKDGPSLACATNDANDDSNDCDDIDE